MNRISTFFMLGALLIGLWSCQDDDSDITTDVTKNLIGITIFTNTNTQICLDAQQLDLLAERDIISAGLCETPPANEVSVGNFDQNGTCFQITPIAPFTGMVSDTLCVFHCYDGTPAICDTTLILVTVQKSFQSGIFVVNEGAFGGGNGTIGHYDPNTQEYTSGIFSSVNGASLGDIVQSMFVHNGQGFIMVNNSNKIEVVELTDFSSNTTISNVQLPRYMCRASDDIAFISQWGSDGINGAVNVYDFQTSKITGSITAGNAPDRMFCAQDQVFILNNGGFGIDSTVMVMDVSTMEIIDTIVVGAFPNGIVGDVRGHIWVGTAGNWMNGSDGTLSILGVGQPAGQINIPNGSANLTYDALNDVLYFTAQGAIWKIEPDGSTNIPAPQMFADGSYYGLGIDPANGLIYAADAKDFSSTGEVVVYNPNGTEFHRFDAGIVPNGFLFL